MQFILTLLISVRGRKLLKDGFALSFTGRAGWFNRLRSKVREPSQDRLKVPGLGCLVFLGSIKN